MARNSRNRHDVTTLPGTNNPIGNAGSFSLAGGTGAAGELLKGIGSRLQARAMASSQARAMLEATKITGQITGTQITDGSISTPKIIAGAISTDKIAAGAVTADQIGANAITSAKIESGAITTAKLAAGSVTALNIASDTITADKIDDYLNKVTQVFKNKYAWYLIGGEEFMGKDEDDKPKVKFFIKLPQFSFVAPTEADLLNKMKGKVWPTKEGAPWFFKKLVQMDKDTTVQNDFDSANSQKTNDLPF